MAAPTPAEERRQVLHYAAGGAEGWKGYKGDYIRQWTPECASTCIPHLVERKWTCRHCVPGNWAGEIWSWKVSLKTLFVDIGCFALILMWGDSHIGSFVPLWCLNNPLGWAGEGHMLCQADNGDVASWVRKGVGRESQECLKKVRHINLHSKYY